MGEPSAALDPGESLVKDSRANLQRGLETVGGRLYLPTKRLLFESHQFNVQTGPTTADLRSITGVTKGWTKFLNVLPLAPNTVIVRSARCAGHASTITLGSPHRTRGRRS